MVSAFISDNGVGMSYSPPDPHPELVRRHLVALEAWQRPGIAEAAAVLGLSQRGYCDSFLTQFPPLTWYATSTAEVNWVPERTYREASEQGNDRGVAI